MTLGSRLLEWLFAPLVFLWLGATFVTFLSFSNAHNDAADDRFSEEIKVVGALVFDAVDARVGAPTLSTPVLSNLSKAFPLHALVDFNGRVTTSNSAELENLIVSGSVSLDRVQRYLVEDEFMHCGSYRRDGRALVLCESNAARVSQAQIAFRHILLAQSFVLLASVFLAWYGLSYLMRPIASLRDELAARALDGKHAIATEQVVGELRPLADAVNAALTRLQRVAQVQSHFIANAAHQLRTPIAAVRVLAEHAQRRVAQNQTAAATEALENLLQQIDRTSRLTAQLLALERARGSEPNAAQQRDVLVTSIASKALLRCASLASARDVVLEFDETGATPRWIVSANPYELEDAIVNVVENAIELSAQSAVVSVMVDAHAHEIRVSDAGPGVNQDDVEHLFQPFARGDGVKHVGAGLGLAICRTVMRRMGGDAFFLPRAAGEGACLVLRFPDSPSM